MSISGLLTTMPLPELLQWVQFAKKTGTVVFERQGIVKKVFLEDGFVVSASSNDPKEYLGQILMCFGWADEQMLNDAFRRQQETRKLIGRVLIEDFGLKEHQILEALRIKIEETIYDLFIWPDGKFIYTAGIPQLGRNERLETALPIDHVLFEGARRQDEWKEFKRTFPADDVIFALKDGRRNLGDLEKDFITQKIYQIIDGTRSMRRIILEARAPEYRGIESFVKLHWGGFIHQLPMTAAQHIAFEEKPISPLAVAANHFKAKECEKAYVVLVDYLEQKPDDEEAKTLMKIVSDGYLSELRIRVPIEAVPEIAIDLSDLSEKVFNSREGFLASRINGQWDVRSLCMVSPLSELESLRIFKRFLDEGIVRFKATQAASG